MKKTKIYLDTSIPSAYFDSSKPVRQLITQKWFELESKNYQLYISLIGIGEIDKISNEIKKDNIKKLIFDNKIEILKLDDKAVKLSREYITKGAIPKSEPEDALHIAIATINKIESLASWNFKHIVSINPIKKIHEINKRHNYIAIEIGSLEIYGGSKYGNL
jgi:predicted nucleic acid-binding protein